MARNPWLFTGVCLSLAAAVLHLAIIVGGPDWYRFFGAGEEMARGAELGSYFPALVTFFIVILLAIASAYAFAGAGLVRRLPLMRTALVVVSATYLARAFALIPALVLYPSAARAIAGPFEVWSSLVVLIYGIAYAVGTWKSWPMLSGKKAR